PEHELSFSVLHMKGRHASIESTVDFTESHVKWRVSSLCPVGLIIPSSLQAVGEQVLSFSKEWIKIDQSRTCSLEDKRYRLKSKPKGEIEPK
ncbi:unnamed protein product, partial [Lota lota]